MPHNQTVLGSLLKGKNLDIFLKRNRVAFSGVSGKNSKKGVISKFELSPLKPQNKTQNTLVCDRDIIKILETSYKTLTYCNLISCMFITSATFKTLANAKNLQWLCLSNNQNLLDSCAVDIVTNCTGLLHLNFSKCTKLTEVTMDAIVDNLPLLESLDVSYDSNLIVNFRNPAYLRNLKKLQELDISYCGISDSKLLTIIKHLPWLETLTVEGCSKLTFEGINEILVNQETSLKKVVIYKTAMERDSQAKLKKLEKAIGDKVQLIYHHEHE